MVVRQFHDPRKFLRHRFARGKKRNRFRGRGRGCLQLVPFRDAQQAVQVLRMDAEVLELERTKLA